MLATGHISAVEHVAIARTFGKRQKILVTHAMEDMVGPKLNAAELVELADLGAWIELCALTCVGALATRPVSDLADAATRVGPGRCTLASDYGQAMNVAPIEGLQQFADLMEAEGLAADAIRTMVVANPADARLPLTRARRTAARRAAERLEGAGSSSSRGFSGARCARRGARSSAAS